MHGLTDHAERCLTETSFSYAELRTRLTRRAIDGHLAAGALVRLRKGTYLAGDCPTVLLDAARHGGRLDCISLIHSLGVFVLARPAMHIQMDPKATRAEPRSDGVVRHWRRTSARPGALATDLVEALAQACRCQPPRAAIATLDSALHLRLIDEGALAAVFDRLPLRYRALRPLIDGRCESGPETLMRLLRRGLGLEVEVQVRLAGVGRVDFVVGGWLIIECDSEAHHGGWDLQLRDRRRDLAAAALGYTTLRPVAQDIMFAPERVIDAVRGLVAARAAVHNVGRSTPRGRRSG
jgi:very-short-patch-repair endonuclease